MSMILMIVLLHVLFGMFFIIVLTSSFVYICIHIYIYTDVCLDIRVYNIYICVYIDQCNMCIYVIVCPSIHLSIYSTYLSIYIYIHICHYHYYFFKTNIIYIYIYPLCNMLYIYIHPGVSNPKKNIRWVANRAEGLGKFLHSPELRHCGRKIGYR